MLDFFDRQGRPLELREWAGRFEDVKYQTVRKSLLRGDANIEIQVSTVWLGLDPSHGDGPPLIFETMIFSNESHNKCMWRYASEEEAVAGHECVVAKLAKDYELVGDSDD